MIKKKSKKNEPSYEKSFLVGSKSTASANECTGLIMTPADPEEMEAYSDIYDIPSPKKNYP